jgi:excisionase family DNA binding protein
MDREIVELAAGARNRLENGSNAVEPEQPSSARGDPNEGLAAWVGSRSESRLRVPTGGAGGSDEPPVRRAEPGDIMTRTEVAALLRCSEPHVVALVEREQLPGFRLGRPWRFRRSEVLAWCERRAHGRRSA